METVTTGTKRNKRKRDDGAEEESESEGFIHPEHFQEKLLTLDVGGEIFRTWRSTLTRDPDSVLAHMFDPSSKMIPARKLENGAYFLDLEPQYFRVVLNHLRYGGPTHVDPSMLDGVKRTAVFLGVSLAIQETKPLQQHLSMADRDHLRLELNTYSTTLSRALTKGYQTTGPERTQSFIPCSIPLGPLVPNKLFYHHHHLSLFVFEVNCWTLYGPPEPTAHLGQGHESLLHYLFLFLSQAPLLLATINATCKQKYKNHQL